MQADQESAGKVVSQVGFQESMTPVPKDPERFRPKRVAVLICIFEGDEGDLRVILTKRSSRLSTHSGGRTEKFSLLGGKAEEDDKDDGMTATREAEEEIGLDPSLIDVVTSLEPFLSKEIVGPPVQDREKERERERERLSFVSAWNSNWEDDQKIILRMKLCRKFCFGEECPYEDRSNFIHEDLSKFLEADRQGSIPVPAAPMINGGGGVKTVYWKTRLCGKFEKGQCPFGDSCHFAHGQAELLQHFVGRVEGEAMNSGACKRSICNETNCTSNSRFFCS
ncbi:hypothetical protein Bca4012_056626 [Brassica carinata]